MTENEEKPRHSLSGRCVVTPELLAAYEFVQRKVPEASAHLEGAPVWYGWALREAFLEGARWAQEAKS